MNTPKDGIFYVNMAILSLVFFAGIIIFSAQEIQADAVNFRSQYQLGQDDLLVSLPNITPLAYEENGIKKGIFVRLMAAMDRLYQTRGVKIAGTLKKGRVIVAGIYPFQRSINNVKAGYADFHIPYLVNPHISADVLKREKRIAYSSAIIGYGSFPLYATKEFAALVSEFELQIGKSVSQLGVPEDYKLFDNFLHQHNISIEANRAHTELFPFTTLDSTHTLFSLKKLAVGRIDGYVHNMQECDMELRTNNIDTSNLVKIKFVEIIGRMIVSATEKGHETDKIISRLVWQLQGRDASDVPLEDTFWSGPQKEVPHNAYLQSETFKKSEWFTLVGATWDIPYTKAFK